MSVAATMNGAAEEKSPGTSISPSDSLSAGHTETFDSRRTTVAPGRLEHALGVVPRGCRLDDRGLTVGRIEPRKEDCGLDLSARDGQDVADRLERPPLDREGQRALGRLDSRAHRRERVRDTTHRA